MFWKIFERFSSMFPCVLTVLVYRCRLGCSRNLDSPDIIEQRTCSTLLIGPGGHRPKCRVWLFWHALTPTKAHYSSFIKFLDVSSHYWIYWEQNAFAKIWQGTLPKWAKSPVMEYKESVLSTPALLQAHQINSSIVVGPIQIWISAFS